MAQHSTVAREFKVTLDGQTLYVEKELAQALGWTPGISTDGVSLLLSGWDPHYFAITQTGTDAGMLSNYVTLVQMLTFESWQTTSLEARQRAVATLGCNKCLNTSRKRMQKFHKMGHNEEPFCKKSTENVHPVFRVAGKGAWLVCRTHPSSRISSGLPRLAQIPPVSMTLPGGSISAYEIRGMLTSRLNEERGAWQGPRHIYICTRN